MNEGLISELEGLKRRDTETRERLLRAGKLHGAYDEEMQRVHVENAKALEKIVSVHGWPGVSKVGLDGCRAAWLVAQHSICTPELQRGFLCALANAADSGDVPMKQVALLTDRIRFHEGKPQVYGTVLDWNENGELGCELEDPEQVDSRRAAAGLPPFQESLQDQRKEIASEGGKAPVDLKAYKEAVAQWAKHVGWQ